MTVINIQEGHVQGFVHFRKLERGRCRQRLTLILQLPSLRHFTKYHSIFQQIFQRVRANDGDESEYN